MTQSASAVGTISDFGGDSLAWVQFVPDGAISIEKQGDRVVLRASRQLHQRFEQLLERRKSAALSTEESEQYEAICELDDALSWLNRLIRGSS